MKDEELRELNKKLAEQAGFYGTPEQCAEMEAEVLAEKNRKLAEWAGFRQVVGYWQVKWQEVTWEYPDGDYCPDDSLPNFTQSLDACFKWLVPKLLATHEVTLHHWDKWEADLFAKVPLSLDSGVVTAETLALALCLAIEKLIDGGAE